jgi:hypothetical protein
MEKSKDLLGEKKVRLYAPHLNFIQLCANGIEKRLHRQVELVMGNKKGFKLLLWCVIRFIAFLFMKQELM